MSRLRQAGIAVLVLSVTSTSQRVAASTTQAKGGASKDVATVNIPGEAESFPGDIPRFVEQALEAGIDHQYDGAWEHFVGGGVASFDCNGDRWPDLFIAGGDAPAALYVNVGSPGGELAFEQRKSGITDMRGVIGAYPLDIDGDDHLDLVVLRVGDNRLLRGGPDCRFSKAPAQWGFDGGHDWTTAFSATFEAGSHYPTLAFGNYVDRTAPGSPWGTCSDNVLLRPRPQPTGSDVDSKSKSKSKSNANSNANSNSNSENGESINGPHSDGPRYDEALALSPGHCALSMLFTDWDRSGHDALRITNDRHYHRGGEEQLWRLEGTRYPRLYGRADGWAPLVIWGMGIAEGDVNADGYPEYALTSMGDTKLQSLDLAQALEEGRPVYDDIARDRGATAHRPYTGDETRPSTGWHAEFDDLNNDARLDLFITKGNVEAMSDFAATDPDNLLLGQADGRFSEQGLDAGLALDRRGRGAAVVDLNMDGRLDIVVVNRAAPVSLFRQQGAKPGGNWLAVELRQPAPNPQAIGARLSVQTGNVVQTRRVSIGGGHASGSLGFVHVGLGTAERATLRVQWPDGEWSAPFRLFADHHVVITRGDEHVTQWFPLEMN